MQYILRLIIFSFVISALASQNPANAQLPPLKAYEMYSWRTPHGSLWNFAIVPHTNSNWSAKEVLNRGRLLQGVGQLKEKMSELPKGASIFWLDRIPSGIHPNDQRSKIIRYPPPGLVKEIQEYAARIQVKLDLDSDYAPTVDTGSENLDLPDAVIACAYVTPFVKDLSALGESNCAGIAKTLIDAGARLAFRIDRIWCKWESLETSTVMCANRGRRWINPRFPLRECYL